MIRWLKWRTIRRNLSNDWAYRHKHGKLFVCRDRRIKQVYWIETGSGTRLDVDLNCAVAWLKHITDGNPDNLIGMS